MPYSLLKPFVIITLALNRAISKTSAKSKKCFLDFATSLRGDKRTLICRKDSVFILDLV